LKNYDLSKALHGREGDKFAQSYFVQNPKKRHYVFIRIEKARICDILTEEEFRQKEIKEFVDYW